MSMEQPDSFELERADIATGVELAPEPSLLERTRRFVTVRRAIGAASAALVLGSGAYIAQYEYETHHTVPEHVVALPSSEVPDILTQPATPLSSPTEVPSQVASPSPTHTEKEKPVIPELAPQAPTHLYIPKLGIDTEILPVSSTPTGQKNPWGGEIYNEVDFPVDQGKQKARYWVEQGEPNTLQGVTYADDPKAVMRTIIYGHASDIHYHLLFQDLQELKIGDTFTLQAGEYDFTYTVYSLSNPAKDGLADDGQVYDLPEKGRKEAALIACLPDSASHSVRIGYLSAVKRVGSDPSGK